MSYDPSDFESPCVRNCCLDEKDVCLGCFRTMQEIMEWGDASEKRRREIMLQAKLREEQRNEEMKNKKPLV